MTTQQKLAQELSQVAEEKGALTYALKSAKSQLESGVDPLQVAQQIDGYIAKFASAK